MRKNIYIAFWPSKKKLNLLWPEFPHGWPILATLKYFGVFILRKSKHLIEILGGGGDLHSEPFGHKTESSSDRLRHRQVFHSSSYSGKQFDVWPNWFCVADV